MFPESEVTGLFLVLCLVPGCEVPELFRNLCAECHLSGLSGVSIPGSGSQGLCHSSLSCLSVRSRNTLQGWCSSYVFEHFFPHLLPSPLTLCPLDSPSSGHRCVTLMVYVQASELFCGLCQECEIFAWMFYVYPRWWDLWPVSGSMSTVWGM